MKSKLFLLVSSVILIFITLTGFTDEPRAACTHLQTGAILYDLVHEYNVCSLCQEKIYTGNSRKLPHGNGRNGTCTQCGTHTYTGRTCVSESVCACGGSATKNHGDGTIGSGTCPQCGEHLYYLANTQSIHPHEATYQCDCGVSYKINTLNRLCAECTANTKIATDTAYKSIIFRSIDGGDGILIGLTAVLDCTVEYYNEYNEPCKNSIIDYGYPPFASLGSAVISSVTCTNLNVTTYFD